jgi:hypothetical protein
MIDLLAIIIRWLAGVLPGGEAVARARCLPLLASAGCGPRLGGCYPASSPGIGWMTMRLDPILGVCKLSRTALARSALAMRSRSAPSLGA